jgi:hypothetical protein
VAQPVKYKKKNALLCKPGVFIEDYRYLKIFIFSQKRDKFLQPLL